MLNLHAVASSREAVVVAGIVNGEPRKTLDCSAENFGAYRRKTGVFGEEILSIFYREKRL